MNSNNLDDNTATAILNFFSKSFKDNDLITGCFQLHTSKAADHQHLRSWTVTLHHTKQVSAEHDPPATSSPWSTSCHGSGPCHGSWWDSSCPEHPRRWVWTYGRPPHRSAGQQGSPHTRAPWDHLRRFLRKTHRGKTTAKMSSHRWTHRLHVFHHITHKRNSFYVNLLVPWVLVTKVLPRLRMLNMAGALTSYQSFLEKGSTLENEGVYLTAQINRQDWLAWAFATLACRQETLQ